MPFQNSENRRSRSREIEDKIVVAAVCAALATSVSLFLYRVVAWPFELVTHFKVQIAVFCSVLSLVCLRARSSRAFFLVLALSVVHWKEIIPRVTSKRSRKERRPLRAYRILLLNLFEGSSRSDLVERLVLREKPDVVVFVEATDKWLDLLSKTKLREEYPFSDSAIGYRGSSEFLLYSRNSFVSCEEDSEHNDLRVLLNAESNKLPTLHLFVEHFANPIRNIVSSRFSREFYDVRSRQMECVARLASSSDEPVLVVGDFNVSTWSPDYKSFLRYSGLKDAARGFGYSPTWNPVFGQGKTSLARLASWALGLEIDHAIHNDRVVITDFHVGSSAGSDHRSLILDIQISQRGS